MAGVEVGSVIVLVAVWLLSEVLLPISYLLVLLFVIPTFSFSFSIRSMAGKRPSTLEELRNLNLHITEIPLSRRPPLLLLRGIITLRCPRWTAFESAVPVVRYEGLPLYFWVER